MSFGPTSGVYAHATVGGAGILPRRDRDLELPRKSVPPVPRAPRAKPRSSSFGVLAKKMWSNQGYSQGDYSLESSEHRRPRDESPLSYARKNNLQRELDTVENQGFVFGPQMICASTKDDFSRCHTLGNELEQQKGGVPLGDLENDSLAVLLQNPARRQTLLHERNAADQTLDFHPSVSTITLETEKSAQKRDRSRKNTLSREQKEMALLLECKAKGADGAGSYARRSALAREQIANAPTPRALGDDFRKRDLLVRELGLKA